MELTKINEAWKEHADERFRKLTFETGDISTLTYLQDSVLRLFHSAILTNMLVVVKNQETSIIAITVNSESEDFSREFCKKIVQNISEYYINNVTEKERETYKVIKKSVDSTYNALLEAEDMYAKWKDASTRYIKMQGSIDELRLRRNIEVLSAIYAEGVKNQEIAKFTLLNKTPYLQIIDAPGQALEIDKLKKKLAAIIGGLIGGFVICTFLIFRKILAEIQSQPI